MTTITGFPLRSLLLLLCAWLIMLIAGLTTRPLMPVDETRYVSVAWEMWLRGDFLVPYLNGEAYSHKPPLFFWLIQAGWWLFGVNDLWPRLVAPLISLVDLGLIALLARRLWPEHPQRAELATWILFGGLMWQGFYTLVQFDLLIVFCTLLGLLGMLRAARGLGTGWLIVGVALGLGLLSKGPVILLHLLPVGLLGYWWVDRAQLQGWVCWYGGLLSAVLLGALIGLAWAVPAGAAGGADYRAAILWGQTAERLVDSFAHDRPVYWYLPWLPLALLPWAVTAPFWQGIGRAWRNADFSRARSLRMLSLWALPVLLILSLVSGKQVKYLLPIFPAFSLLAAYAIDTAMQSGAARRPWAAAGLALIPAVLFAGVLFGWHSDRADWTAALDARWGLVFVALAIGLLLQRYRTAAGLVRVLALATVLVVTLLHVAVLWVAKPAYDLRTAAARIHALQQAGHPLAHIGSYHGQFQFVGRLQQPLTELADSAAHAWAIAHPDGYFVLYHRDWPGLPPAAADYVQDYRGEHDDLALWSVRAWLAAQ